MNNYIVRIRFVSVQSCCILSNFRITCKNAIHYNDNVMNDNDVITLIRTLQMISCRSNVYINNTVFIEYKFRTIVLKTIDNSQYNKYNFSLFRLSLEITLSKKKVPYFFYFF